MFPSPSPEEDFELPKKQKNKLKDLQSKTNNLLMRKESETFSGSLHILLVQERDDIDKKNFVCSCHSVFTALALLSGGAAGKTLEEINNVLRTSPKTIHDDICKLNDSLDKKKQNLYFANGIFLSCEATPIKKYIELCKDKYHAGIKTVDFKNDPDTAIKEINEFCSKNTKGMIKKVVGPKISPTNKVVLINAIYFKAKWNRIFENASTTECKFQSYGLPHKTIKVKLMNKFESYDFFAVHEVEDVKFESCTILYREKKFGMVFIKFLENTKNSFFRFERKVMTKKNFIKSIVDDQKHQEMERVSIPKFEIESKIQLSDILQDMGLNAPFDADLADFSKLIAKKGGENLKVSKVLHLAKMRVDETGTEAAAITYISGSDGSDGCDKPPCPSFVLDRPFWCFLIHRKSNTVIFSAKVKDPNVKN